MIPSLLTAPTSPAIPWTEVKSHLRLDSDDEQARVEAILVPAATDWAQSLLNRQLMPATWAFWFPNFWAACAPAQRHCGRYPADSILLPYPPLQSVTWVKYYDLNNVQQTWSTSDYTVSAPAGPKCGPGWIRPVPGAIFPSTYCRPDAVEIKAVCGYASASAVPAGIKAGMLLHIGEQFERREQAISGTIIAEVPQNAIALALPYLVEV